MVNAACGGYRPAPEFDPGHVPEPHALEGTPLTRLWRSRPVRNPSAPIALDQTNVYLGGSDRRVVAVDLESGRTRWAVRVPGPLVGGTQVRDSLVYAATDRPGGKVYAFSTVSGNTKWSRGTGYVQAPLLLMGTRLIALTRTGRMVALGQADGKEAWTRAIPSNKVAPIALDNEHFAVTSYDSVYRVRLTDGKIVERRKSPGTVVSPWVRVGHTIVASTADSQVVALTTDSLTLAWSARLDAPAITSPAVDGDTLYVLTRTGSLYRINSAGGPWISQLGTSAWPATGAPAAIGDWVVAGAADGSLRAFDPTDGSERWHTALGRPFELAPVPLPDGSFLALGGRGDLHRIKP
ncbi:MAG TPA: PQQ-binding-like beta-propeller repeat protein [Gemmatimonadales bacterium]|nr:PQQ-binding-like beta-propeller repeat protein [Gemmatimonadales bacterium]